MDVSVKSCQTNQCTFGEHLRILCASSVVLILLGSTVATQGIYISYLKDGALLPISSLWIPVLFLASFYISKPWCRESAENWIEDGSRNVKVNILSAIIVAICIGVNGYLHIAGQILTFGVINGLGSSFIITRLENFLDDRYQYHTTSIHVLIEFSIAFGHLLIPKIIDILVYQYGVHDAPIIHSAIILHVIPATMLIKNYKVHGPPVITSRYSNYQRPEKLLNISEKCDTTQSNNLLESPYESNTNLSSSGDLTQNDTFRSWKSPSDSAKSSDSIHEMCEEKSDSSSSTSEEYPDFEDVEKDCNTKCKNMYGVEILPEIPEEIETSSSYSFTSESEDPHRKNYSANLNRLSMIYDHLKHIISRDEINYHIDKEVDSFEIAPANNNVTESSTQTGPDKDIIENHIKSGQNVAEWIDISCAASLNQGEANNTCNLCCAPYQRFSLWTCFLSRIESIKYTIGIPLSRSIYLLRFYPTLLLKVCTVSNLFIFTTLIPIYVKKSNDYYINQNSSSFFILVASLSWISILVLTPWTLDIRKSKFKYISVIGLSILAFVFYKIIHTTEDTRLAVMSIVFGISFGAISFVEDTVMREELGTQHFSKVRGTIETVTGITIIIYVFTLNLILSKYQENAFFAFILGLNIIGSFMWLIVIFIRIIKKPIPYDVPIELDYSFSHG